jgi:hypothetical protein
VAGEWEMIQWIHFPQEGYLRTTAELRSDQLQGGASNTGFPVFLVFNDPEMVKKSPAHPGMGFASSR